MIESVGNFPMENEKKNRFISKVLNMNDNNWKIFSSSRWAAHLYRFKMNDNNLWMNSKAINLKFKLIINLSGRVSRIVCWLSRIWISDCCQHCLSILPIDRRPWLLALLSVETKLISSNGSLNEFKWDCLCEFKFVINSFANDWPPNLMRLYDCSLPWSRLHFESQFLGWYWCSALPAHSSFKTTALIPVIRLSINKIINFYWIELIWIVMINRF